MDVAPCDGQIGSARSGNLFTSSLFRDVRSSFDIDPVNSNLPPNSPLNSYSLYNNNSFPLRSGSSLGILFTSKDFAALFFG